VNRRRWPVNERAAARHGIPQMNNDRFPVSVKGVAFSAPGQVILLLNERQEWELPGGRLEVGETPEQAVVREFEEELAATVTPCRILDSYLFEVIPERFVFIVTYGCRIEGTFSPSISEEHLQVGTFDVDALPEPLPSGYRRSILAWHAQI
jgi:8-oxo-dGTP pyrophosphatase MutT (NUDIX family)